MNITKDDLSGYVLGLMKAYDIVSVYDDADDAVYGHRVLVELARVSPEYMQELRDFMARTRDLVDGHWVTRRGSAWHESSPDNETLVYVCGGTCLLRWPPYRIMQGWP